MKSNNHITKRYLTLRLNAITICQDYLIGETGMESKTPFRGLSSSESDMAVKVKMGLLPNNLTSKKAASGLICNGWVKLMSITQELQK